MSHTLFLTAFMLTVHTLKQRPCCLFSPNVTVIVVVLGFDGFISNRLGAHTQSVVHSDDMQALFTYGVEGFF